MSLSFSSSSCIKNNKSADCFSSPLSKSTSSNVKQVGFRLLANGKDK